MQPGEVLDFWFDGVQSEPSRLPERMRIWFGSQQDGEAERQARDHDIELRFGPHMQARRRGELDSWSDSPTGRLALILLVDQFPRSIHRGRPEAFADDRVARELCTTGIESGHDLQLGPIERVFFYLPLEHSESLADQDRCLALMTTLERSAPPGLEEAFAGFTKYAVWHRDIVARFGRFPHRNRILGRSNTRQEATYLAGDSPGFGQR